jgi:hypothetical protein
MALEAIIIDEKYLYTDEGKFVQDAPASESIQLYFYNNSGSTIVAGKCVYISGWNNTYNQSEINLCDVTDTDKMPCVGVVPVDILHGASGLVTLKGFLDNIFPYKYGTEYINQRLYIGISGNLTTVQTEGYDNQNIGYIDAPTKIFIEGLYTPPESLSDSSDRRVKVINNTGTMILANRVIQISGWDGVEFCPEITLADKDTNTNYCFGITNVSIADGEVGYVLIKGNIYNAYDTSTVDVGDLVYLGDDGNIRFVKTDSRMIQPIGQVLESSVTGSIFFNFSLPTFQSLSGFDAVVGSDNDGDSVPINAGDGDGSGDGGDIALEPGTGGATGEDGVVIIKQPGTTKAQGYFAQLWHDGVDFLFRVYEDTLAGTFVFLNKVIFRYVDDIDETNQIEIEHDGTDASLKTKKGNFLFEGVKFLFRKLGAADGTKDLEIWLDTTDNHIHMKSNSGYIKIDSTAFQVMAASYSAGKHLDIGHDGTDAFIFTTVGELSTKNTVVNTGTAKIKSATALLSSLTASQTVETDVDKNLVSAEKKSAYNKDFGYRSGEIPEIGNDFSASQVVETNSDKELRSAEKKTAYNLDLGTEAGTVCVGNDSRLSDTRTPSDGSVDENKMATALPDGTLTERELQWDSGTGVLQVRTKAYTVVNGIITVVGDWSEWDAVASV